MTTTIPNPPANPIPYTSTFEGDMTAWLAWLTDNASKFGDVAGEVNDALNTALLSVTSTSTSSITIASTGTINITVEANKGYAIGMTVKIASVANPANYVKGTVTAYNKTTGAMSVLLFNKGGSGTFADWSVFFDVPDPSVLSVPTGEVVAAGNLLAIDDAGNSMSAGAVTTAVLQAVTATSLHACPLANGNTAIFWTEGTTSVLMMIISKTGSTVLAKTAVFTAQNSTFVWSAELTNGNIVLCCISGANEAAFRILNTSGGAVVTAQIEAGVTATGQIKCCALTGGGFAVTYNTATNNRIAVLNNSGASVLAPTTNVTGAQTRVAICPTAAGGFIALAGTNALTGNIYNSSGGLVAASAINISTGSASADANIAAMSGSCAAAGSATVPQYGPVVSLASDSANALVNSATGGNLKVPFDDAMSFTSSLGHAHIAALANGNYMATFSTRGNNEYPRYAIFNSIGQLVDSGILFEELTHNNSPVFVIPKDTNGYSLIWLAANQNVKFAQVKSGNVVGVSLGAVGSTHQYLANGAVTLANKNILNVGDSKVNYSRRGTKVVI